MSEDYAWAAGFWDGEGNVSLTYRGANNIPRIVLQIAQVDREVLDRFQSIMGVGNVLGPYPARNERSQDYHVWRVEGVPHLAEFQKKLWDYLGTIKRNQIQAALDARSLWEQNSECVKGHRLSQSAKGHWRCVICQSEQGKKNAAARWSKES